MSGYLFSIKPKTFEKIETKFQELEELKKKTNEITDLKTLRPLTKKQEKIEEEIMDLLIQKKERNEFLESFEDEIDELSIVLDFVIFFAKRNFIMADIKENPIAPDRVKKYWERLEHLLQKGREKKAALLYCKKSQTAYTYEIKNIESVFDKWVSVLKHAAENGNWFYYVIRHD